MTTARCLTEGCMRFGHSRGHCQKHYARLAKLVSKGEITWEDLESAGKATQPVSNKQKMRNYLPHTQRD